MYHNIFAGTQSPWGRHNEARQNERLRGLSATVTSEYAQLQVIFNNIL